MGIEEAPEEVAGLGEEEEARKAVALAMGAVVPVEKADSTEARLEGMLEVL